VTSCSICCISSVKVFGGLDETHLSAFMPIVAAPEALPRSRSRDDSLTLGAPIDENLVTMLCEDASSRFVLERSKTSAKRLGHRRFILRSPVLAHHVGLHRIIAHRGLLFGQYRAANSPLMRSQQMAVVRADVL
jgi:hypothetical protein